jgi:hypothetical protein
MTKSSKHLLVEGDCDRLFFEACCRHAKLQDIEVGPPITLGAASNGKGNAIALLPKLIDQMKLETVTHLALVVDADATQTNGLGFVKTWDKITEELAKKGYHIPQRPSKPNGGICFEHKDGYPPVGLWIMPDNCSNGFLEDFIKKSLAGVEKSLFQHATTTVCKLPEPKRFKSHHTNKAEVASYMAWQESPGQGLHGAVGGNLIEFKKGLAKQYIDWLRKVFTR